MIRISLILICATGLLVCLSPDALACMCGSTDAESQFTASDVVFTGKVTRIVRTKEAYVVYSFKQSGTLAEREKPQWEKFSYGARIVTLEVSEAFKGVSSKTIEVLTSVYDNGATCGVNFKEGESYLVYGYKRRHELKAEQAKTPQAEWQEISLKIAADEYNKHLPALGTSYCARTERIRWATDDLAVIHRILMRSR